MSMDHFRLFPDDTDPLLRYKADAERREQEAAAKREREARERPRRRAAMSVMKSRRFIQSPRRHGLAQPPVRRGRAPWRS
jgi:hypothetical protein